MKKRMQQTILLTAEQINALAPMLNKAKDKASEGKAGVIIGQGCVDPENREDEGVIGFGSYTVFTFIPRKLAKIIFSVIDTYFEEDEA